jgi:hypothetical protein
MGVCALAGAASSTWVTFWLDSADRGALRNSMLT